MKNTDNAANTTPEAIANATLTTPFKRMELKIGAGFTATLTGVRSYMEPDKDGNAKAKMRFEFAAEEGTVTLIQQIHTPGCRDFVTSMFRRAVGTEKLSDIPDAIGKQVTLTTFVDTYDGKIKIKYVNRFNPFADQVVDLTAFDNEVKPEPKKLVFG